MTAQQIENIIYSTALQGTPVNKSGVPENIALLLVAQAKHETGNFKSNGFLQGNNAFGYSYVRGGRYQLSDPGLIADNGQPLAKYQSVADSTREIVDWIYRRIREGKFPSDLRTIQTSEEYARLLKGAGYYGDTVSNYSKGLAYWLRGEYLKELDPKYTGPGLLLMALGIFVVYRLSKRSI